MANLQYRLEDRAAVQHKYKKQISLLQVEFFFYSEPTISIFLKSIKVRISM